MSDPVVLAWLAWVSSSLTAIGLVIAIYQIREASAQARKAASAAAAAEKAAKGAVSVVREKERQIKLSIAIELVNNARIEWSRHPSRSIAYLNLCSSNLSGLLELLDDDPGEIKVANLQRTRINSLIRVLADDADFDELRPIGTHVGQLTKISNALEEMSSRVRYRYEGRHHG